MSETAKHTIWFEFWADDQSPKIQTYPPTHAEDLVFGPYVLEFEFPEAVYHERERRKIRPHVTTPPAIEAKAKPKNV